MKCELCHENDAETAIQSMRNGAEEELYVCSACARRERLRRQKKSQRTRKAVSMSGDEVVSGFFESLIDAVHGAMQEIDRKAESEMAEQQTQTDEPQYETLPCGRADRAFRIGPRLHLEGLYLTGDLESVKRAFHALDMELEGITADGVRDAGRTYAVRYRGSAERARRVVQDLLAQERNARVHLLEELPRVLADSLGRALAILKNCRLISPGELYDLLSPIRLGLQEKLLDGIGLRDLTKLLDGLDLSSREDRLSPEERDRIDAERADMINERFEDVVLNERAEDLLK